MRRHVFKTLCVILVMASRPMDASPVAVLQACDTPHEEAVADTQHEEASNSATIVLQALRARVTGGAIFSNGRPVIIRDNDQGTARFESPQFGQASAYLAFDAQPTVLNFMVPNNTGNSPDGSTRPTASTSSERNYPRFSLDSLVNVRLTTIPVAGTRHRVRLPMREFGLRTHLTCSRKRLPKCISVASST